MFADVFQKPDSVIFSIGERRLSVSPSGGTFSASGTCLEIDSEGKITLTSEKSAPEYVYLNWSQSVPAGAVVYGDHWECGHGDLCWSAPDGDRPMPWYCLAVSEHRVYGFGVKTRPNCLCSWRLSGDTLTLILDFRCGGMATLLNGRRLEAATLVSFCSGEPVFTACRSFTRKMCGESVLMNRPVYGGNDWYCCYGQNSFDVILTHADRVSRCAGDAAVRPYMVIDDGWSVCRRGLNDGERFNGGPWN